MSAGIPVISSDFPLWKEIVEENECGICVDPMDTHAIADAVEYICNHPSRSKQMGENGRKLIKEKYNWKEESKKLISIYENLVKV
jgi:glycosyltransferase involved in cell wall biosynthesis